MSQKESPRPVLSAKISVKLAVQAVSQNNLPLCTPNPALFLDGTHPLRRTVNANSSPNIMKTKLDLFQARLFCALALGVGSSSGLVPQCGTAGAGPAPAKAFIPWWQIGVPQGCRTVPCHPGRDRSGLSGQRAGVEPHRRGRTVAPYFPTARRRGHPRRLLVDFDAQQGPGKIFPLRRPLVELEHWIFSGAWMLELGI